MPLRDPSPGPYRAGFAPHDVCVKGREGKGIGNWFYLAETIDLM